MVDDLTFIKSTNTDAINHEPAIMLMNTGNMNAGKPCLGAWLAYGLGSMNDNLPTFVVLQTKSNPKENNQPVSSRLWSSGFLSSEFSGVIPKPTRASRNTKWRFACKALCRN